MMTCRVSDVTLYASQDIILTWDKGENNVHHTKPEYVKILADAHYQISYEIKWRPITPTTQPLQITIYRVSKEFTMHALQQNVTVCTSNPITLKKKFSFGLTAGERICIGAKNFSTVNFILMNSQLSLTKI